MSSFLETAIKAAKSAGDLLKEHYYKDKEVDSYEQYDIKLELDVMSQNLISEVILNDFPDHSIIGEEGDSLSNQSEYHWVVDPIDGTVNYFYGITFNASCIYIPFNEKIHILATTFFRNYF